MLTAREIYPEVPLMIADVTTDLLIETREASSSIEARILQSVNVVKMIPDLVPLLTTAAIITIRAATVTRETRDVLDALLDTSLIPNCLFPNFSLN